MKIVLASTDKQKITEEIEEIFLSKVLGFDGALITDESRISDFFMFPLDRAVRPGTKPGHMIFNITRIKNIPGVAPINWPKGYRKDKSNWITEEWEQEPDPSMEEIVQKCKDIFGVDIKEVYKKNIVDILMHIVENYKPKT